MNNEKTKFVHIEVSTAESERKFEEMFVSIIYRVRLKLSAHLGAQYVQILHVTAKSMESTLVCDLS